MKSASKASPSPSEKAPRAPASALARDPALEAATLEHYADPVLYDHEYRRRRIDVNYYRALAAGKIVPLPSVGSEEGAPRVLELGCGSGRLLVPLVRDGVRVVGVDLSGPMLERCRERLARLPPGVRGRAEVQRGDFRKLDLGRRFPLIVTPFNAMMHLYTRADLEHFLDGVRRHLLPGGVFAFDVLNPDLKWLTRDSEKRWARTRFKDPRTERVYYYSTNHAYDPATQINWIRLFYDEAERADEGRKQGGDLSLDDGPGRDAGGRGERGRAFDQQTAGADAGDDKRAATRRRRPRIIHLAQRQFFPEELLTLLEYNGFSVDKREGGFAGEAFDGDADSQVCRCSIRGGARR